MHHSTTASRVIRIAAGSALAISAALGLTAFSASSAFAAKKSSSPSASSIQKALKAYQTCLAKHGVKLPKRSGARTGGPGGFGGFSPGSGGTGDTTPGGPPPGGGFPGARQRFASNSKFAKAAAACKSKLPKGFGQFGRGNGRPFTPTPAQQAALTKFEQCMAAHGVKIASNASFQTIRSLIQADPSAANACRSDLNGVFGRPPGAPGGSTSTTTAS